MLKVGDKIRIISTNTLDKEWEHQDDYRTHICSPVVFHKDMRGYCDKMMTIDRIPDGCYETCYSCKEDCHVWSWTEQMFNKNDITDK